MTDPTAGSNAAAVQVAVQTPGSSQQGPGVAGQQQPPVSRPAGEQGGHAGRPTFNPSAGGPPRPPPPGMQHYGPPRPRPMHPGAPRPASTQPPNGSRITAPPPEQRKSKVSQLLAHAKGLPGVIVVGVAGTALLAWGVVKTIKRLRGNNTVGEDGKPANAKARCANVKATAWCVPLEDGSACVVRRKIPQDNSCLFNSVAYVFHHSKQKAAFLRGVVAREVSSDPGTYSSAFLGMNNLAYTNWIMNPVNWGGGIELAILARHYGREIGAWNIESGKQHVFGEDAGYPRAAMLIYTGTHYDALAIAQHPKAPESEDKTEFNPRTRTGKMIVAAAAKLTQLSQKKGPKGRYNHVKPRSSTASSSGKELANGSTATGAVNGQPVSLKCEECGTICEGSTAAAKHAGATGHTRFAQTK